MQFYICTIKEYFNLKSKQAGDVSASDSFNVKFQSFSF